MDTTEQKVSELLKNMTIEEKIAQLSCTIPLKLLKDERVDLERLREDAPIGLGRMTQFATGFFSGAASIAEGYNTIQKYHAEQTEHKIPVLIQNETAAGLVADGATIFPIPLAVASTWDEGLAYKMGEVICDEAKAIGVRQCLSPVADVAREARWGRVGETYGEDPYLVTQMSVSKVKGLQKDSYGNNVIACAKHFMGYGASERGINTAVINLGEKELREVHGTPFGAMIKDAKLQSLMVTYSEIDGLPMSVNAHYMNTILREQMGFEGSAMCDAMSILKSHESNGIAFGPKEIAAKALRTGIDADTPMTMVYQLLKEAIEEGMVDESHLDTSVARILRQKFELGLMDQPYISVPKASEQFTREDGGKVSKEICEKEIVLLKNDGILPLSKSTAAIGVVGPFADRLSTLFGGYAYPSFVEMIMNIVCQEDTSMEGISDFFRKLLDFEDVRKKLNMKEEHSFEENLENYLKENYGITTLLEELKETYRNSKILHGNCGNEPDALETAGQISRQSEVIIATLGEVTGFGKDATSGEGVNNYDLNLPGNQEKVLQALCESGKPVILILFNGRPLTIPYAAEHCAAILEVWYPGPFGGRTVADAISGAVNPGGRLPVSFPKASGQCPVYYGHKAGSGYRKARFSVPYQKDDIDHNLAPLYPFGYGLSYTTFSYSDFTCAGEMVISAPLQLSVKVTNTGNARGDEVVQLYSQTLGASITRPVLELRGYRRVTLEPQESKTITFTIDPKQLAYLNDEMEWAVEPAQMRFFIGKNAHEFYFEQNVDLRGEKMVIAERDRVFSSKAEVHG